MTVRSLLGVGFCAQMTRTGDWAFEFAYDVATRFDVRLDIFIFPTPTGRPHAPRGQHGELAKVPERTKVELEKDVRFYYDERLGEFVNVGFRLCEGDEEPELRSCLLERRQYNLLVLAYEGYYCGFGSRRIEEFAESMPCPVVLVGPERPDQFYVNTPGRGWVERFALESADWNRISDIVVQDS